MLNRHWQIQKINKKTIPVSYLNFSSDSKNKEVWKFFLGHHVSTVSLYQKKGTYQQLHIRTSYHFFGVRSNGFKSKVHIKNIS